MSRCSEYGKKLKDPRWQKRRLEVFQRDKFACLLCGDTLSTLHVHHLKYSDQPWDAPIEHLETLCEDCHEWRTLADESLQMLFFEKKPVCPSKTLRWLIGMWLPLLNQPKVPHLKEIVPILEKNFGSSLGFERIDLFFAKATECHQEKAIDDFTSLFSSRQASDASWAETSMGPSVPRHDVKQTCENITGESLADKPGEGVAAQQTATLTGDVAGSLSLQTAGEALRESMVPTAVEPKGSELISP